MSIIGTKNLGLIKAIHVGVNPPLNTKILWYNDANTPYTTGPAKVHYYYDVILADWYPLIGGAAMAGGYTYIGYATDCNGAGFTLNFDASIHCYWAVVTSSVIIPNIELRPDLFEDKWTEFCKCDTDNGTGSFVYVRYTDDCKNGEIYTEPKYQVECVDCTYADSYRTAEGSSGAFSVSPNAGGGVDIVITGGVTTNKLILDTQIFGADLFNLTNYSLEISTAPTFSGELSVDLGNDGDAVVLITPVTAQKTTHQAGPNSQIVLEIGSMMGTMNTIISLKLGTANCVSYTPGDLCWKCRKYWAIIVSDTPIAEDDINLSLFENLWMPISCDCGCGSSSGGSDECCKILEEQINTIYKILEKYESQVIFYYKETNEKIEELSIQIERCCASGAGKIAELQKQIETLTALYNNMQAYYDEKIIYLENRIEECCESSGTGVLEPFIRDIAKAEQKFWIDGDYAKDKSSVLLSIDNVDNNIRADFSEAGSVINSRLESVENIVEGQGLTLSNHETRITNLEGDGIVTES